MPTYLDAALAALNGTDEQKRIARVNLFGGIIATVLAYSFSTDVTEVGPLKLPNFQF